MKHWAKNSRTRHTTFYDTGILESADLDLRRDPYLFYHHEVPIAQLKAMFRYRPSRFVSHAPRGPIHKRAPRRLKMLEFERLPLPQIPPEVFDVPKRWLELAQSLTGAPIPPGVIWPNGSGV